MEHTKKQWVADGSVVEPFDAPNGCDICVTASGMIATLSQPNEETESNAKLIALAPELLKQLVYVSEVLTTDMEFDQEDIDDILSIVKKATT